MLGSRLAILGAAVLWSTGGAAIKLCNLSPWQIAGGRSLVAGVVLFLALRETRRRPDRTTLAVAIAYAGTVVLFVLANKLTTSANAIFLQDTAPGWVLLLSPWLLRESPTRGEVLSLPVYAVGLGLFFLDELSPGQVAGNVVALASGASFALCIVGLRRAGSRGPAALVWGNAIGFVTTLPFWFSGPTPAPLDYALVAYLGVFQLGLAYLLFTRGLAHTPAVEASLLVLLEPVLNPIWAFLFAGETPGPWAIAGGTIILAATAWRTLQPWVSARARARTSEDGRAGARDRESVNR